MMTCDTCGSPIESTEPFNWWERVTPIKSAWVPVHEQDCQPVSHGVTVVKRRGPLQWGHVS